MVVEVIREKQNRRGKEDNKNVKNDIMAKQKAIYPKKPTRATRMLYERLDELENVKSADKTIQSKLNIIQNQFKSRELKSFKTAKRLSSLLVSNVKNPIKKFDTAYNRVINRSKNAGSVVTEVRQRKVRQTKKSALKSAIVIKISNIREMGLKGFKHVFDQMEEVEKLRASMGAG
jgi:hypothetical protein